MRLRIALAAAFLFSVVFSPVAAAQNALKRYESKYYILYSDLAAEVVDEAEHRITVMAEEYHQRTKGFAGQITKKLPFYLFKDPSDYYAAGGLQGSAGVFNGEKLMAIGNADLGLDVWHVIQHEGFHQFVHAVIGGAIPIWVNEGLAEYFGEGVYTGDGYVLGVVPQQRLARIKAWIQSGKTISIKGMMKMQHETWNAQMSLVNYDQAWSMVYFLAHGKGGRYQDEFNKFLNLASRSTNWEEAWNTAFRGGGTREFERQWKEYWEAMPANPSAELYSKASVATLTSFYARAFSQKQYFETFDDFLAAAKAGKLKSHEKDWLPPALLERELRRSSKAGNWDLVKRGAKKELRCVTADGRALVGQFQVTPSGRVRDGSVEVVEMKKSQAQPR